MKSLGFDRERWARTRSRGRLRYVVVHGVAMWGLSVFLAVAVIGPWLLGHHDQLTPARLLVSAVVWAVGGLMFGVLTWHFSEKAYLSRKSE